MPKDPKSRHSEVISSWPPWCWPPSPSWPSSLQVSWAACGYSSLPSRAHWSAEMPHFPFQLSFIPLPFVTLQESSSPRHPGRPTLIHCLRPAWFQKVSGGQGSPVPPRCCCSSIVTSRVSTAIARRCNCSCLCRLWCVLAGATANHRF